MNGLQPTPEHVRVHRSACRLAPDYDLNAWRDEAYWLLELAEAEVDEWPVEVTANSATNNRALIAAVDAELSWRHDRGVSRGPVDVGIPRELIDEIKRSVRLELEIAVDVELRGARTLTGRCPFHDDRSPSLVVWSDSQNFRCFGCQVGGDIVAYLQLRHRWSFIEALQHLADRTAIALPQSTKMPPKAPNMSLSNKGHVSQDRGILVGPEDTRFHYRRSGGAR